MGTDSETNLRKKKIAQGFKSIYLQQPIHFATVLINKTYSTITRQIEITNNH